VKFWKFNPNIWKTTTVWLVLWLRHELVDLGVRVPAGDRDFSLLQIVHPFLGANTTPFSMGSSAPWYLRALSMIRCCAMANWKYLTTFWKIVLPSSSRHRKLFTQQHRVASHKTWILRSVKGKKGKVFPLQARCGPEGGCRYSSTLPWPRH